MARQSEVRSAVLSEIRNNPQGITLSQLVKRDITGRSYLANTILPLLVRNGLVFETEESGVVKYYPHEGAVPTPSAEEDPSVPIAEISLENFKFVTDALGLKLEEALAVGLRLILEGMGERYEKMLKEVRSRR